MENLVDADDNDGVDESDDPKETPRHKESADDGTRTLERRYVAGDGTGCENQRDDKDYDNGRVTEAGVFGEDKAEQQAKVDVTRMQAKIGELALANDFLESALVKAGLLSAKR